MNGLQFADWLNSSQRDPRLNEILYPYATEKTALRIITQYETNAELASNGKYRYNLCEITITGQLSLDGFMRYLFSNENSVVAEEHYDLRKEEMNEPLSHFYINTSHNTYLSGMTVTICASN
jgi:phosphatidylinositol phospholipase C beta